MHQLRDKDSAMLGKQLPREKIYRYDTTWKKKAHCYLLEHNLKHYQSINRLKHVEKKNERLVTLSLNVHCSSQIVVIMFLASFAISSRNIFTTDKLRSLI